ncbi:HIT domain-containing protein [Nostocoides sp. HKS02]|uniref:HIT domain-containing protein n=1 Tax=Nostocoides sp. HKS02 TaxID=1813880 RepID=UPI0012B4436C|nr:HIT domain-containing protein [Tetrasphaera sp. HKS02]QGN56963.1 HIT domain-containing protein [Tetrasphaera sp. HKS02]
MSAAAAVPTDPHCLFCRIVAGEIPATVVREDEHTVAFRDLEPQAPTHVLVIPRRHVPNVAALAEEAPDEVVALVDAVAAVARAEGVDEGGYRLVFNTGAQAHQTVFHAHAHVLGGRPMAWPPG